MKTFILVLALATLASSGYISTRRVVKTQQQTREQAPAAQQLPVHIEVEHEDVSQGYEEQQRPLEHNVNINQGSVEVVRAAPARNTTSSYVTLNRGRPAVQKTKAELDREREEEEREAEEEERIAKEQSLSANYQFGSAVDDGIMDHSHVRQESREGGKVTGSYSYSDGFVKRTVHYEADDAGYRVVSEEHETIGNGPTIDLVNGKADVHTHYEGVNTKYSIHADDIARNSSREAELPERREKENRTISRPRGSYSS